MPAKGIQRVKLKMRQVTEDIGGQRTNAAIYAVLSQGQAMAATLTPIDTGHLVNSAFGPVVNGKTGRVGYTAEYAFWVHQAPGKLKGQPRQHFGKTSNHSDFGPQRPVAFGGGTGVGNYWDPNAEPKFLAKGFDRIKPAIPQILKVAYAR